MPLQRRQDHHRHALAPDVTQHLSNNPNAPVVQMPVCLCTLRHTVGGQVSQDNTLIFTHTQTFNQPPTLLLFKGKVPLIIYYITQKHVDFLKFLCGFALAN